MNRYFKKILVSFLLVLLFANDVLAVTVQKMYSISGRNVEMVKSGLLNIYNNNIETDGVNYTYLFDNQDRYYVAYLSPINDYYYYYYYLSNVNDQKNTEMLDWLKKIGYTASEITGNNFINVYKNDVLSKQNQFGGKLKAIKNGTLGSFNAQKTNSNYQNGYANYQQTNNVPYNNQYVIPQINYGYNNQYQPNNIVNYGYNNQANYTSSYNNIPMNNQYNSLNSPNYIPAGYSIKVIPTNLVAICSATRNQTYTTWLAEDIFVNGKVAIPKGSQVIGTINPNIYTDYNRNYFDIHFNKIVKPDGQVINITTENRIISNTLRTQSEYQVNNSYSSISSSNNNNTGGGMSTGAMVALGLLAVGVVAAGVLIAAKSGSSTTSSSKDTTTSSTKYTPTTSTRSYTTTTAHRLYLTNQTPKDLCPNNDVTIEKNALIDIRIANPVYLPI